MRKFIMYLGVLVIFVTLVIFIEWSNKYMNSLVARTYDHLALRALVQIIGCFLFGLFLGSLNFIHEFKKDGCWKISKERLLALGLPSFAIIVIIGSVYVGIVMPQIIQTILFYIMTMDMIKYIAIFLGYIVVSSFTKESEQ